MKRTVLVACFPGCGWNDTVTLDLHRRWTCPDCAAEHTFRDHRDEGGVLLNALDAQSTSTNTCKQVIDELWSDEHCVWWVRLDGGKWWNVVLEWTDQRVFTHGASWVTYTWEFCDKSLEEALEVAADWCQELAPWKPCLACDGQGSWNDEACWECDGTGADASPEADR